MSMLPEMRRCSNCGRMYPFNPSVGLGIVCPHCGKMGLGSPAPGKDGGKMSDLLRRIVRKK